jgi:hypothetical protein
VYPAVTQTTTNHASSPGKRAAGRSTSFNMRVTQFEYFPAVPSVQEGRLRAYQLSLFDKPLTPVPRYQIGRDIQGARAYWSEDNGKEGKILNFSAWEDVAYIFFTTCIVPKSMGFSDPVLMELPAGLFGGSSWDGHDTTRCGSSRVLLSVCIKGKRKLKVCIL